MAPWPLKGVNEDIANDIRDAALNHMCIGLRRMGIPEEEIIAARKQCVDQDSDMPLLDLVPTKRSLTTNMKILQYGLWGLIGIGLAVAAVNVTAAALVWIAVRLLI